MGTVTNTGGDNLRCRTAPINGTVIVSLAPGTQVEVRGPVSNGWYPVRCSGQNGFVSAQYLTVSGGPTPTATPPTVTPTTTPGTTIGTVTNTGGDNLRCRTAPINGTVIVSLAPGTQVEVRGPVSNGWYPVRCDGQNGFVSAQYLTVSGGPTPTVTPTVPPTMTPTTTPGTTTGTVTNTGGDNLRCRTAPINGTVIVSLAPGTQVEVRGPVSNGWYPVRCNGQNGFVSAQYLTVSGGPTPTATPVTPTPTTTPPPNPTYGTVTNTGGDSLRCRTAPVSGAVITSFAPGAQVEIRGPVSNGWYPVRCDGQNGFVSAEYLTVGGNPPTATGYIDTAGGVNANCRNQASLNGTVITTLAFGSQVTIRGNASNGWTPVRCANQDGWVSTQLISSQPPVAFGPFDRIVRSNDVTRARRRSRAATLQLLRQSAGYRVPIARHRLRPRA
jgi:uncharacterized protein YgiM (DUF1202 family)